MSLDIPVVPFKAGSPIFIAGPTNSGKTYWVYRLLAAPNMFDQPVASIIYYYSVYQPLYQDIERDVTIPIKFKAGLPTKEDIEEINDKQFHIIVIDDLMEQIVENKEMQELVIKYCHHNNITAILLSQNIFQKGRYSRTISLNMHNTVLFANKRDKSQVNIIGRQFYPLHWQSFVDVFSKVTEKEEDHPYLLIDCTPSHPGAIQLRTKIFPPETCIVYNIC